MAKSKKRPKKQKVVVKSGVTLPRGRTTYLFSELQPPKEDGTLSAFYVDEHQHQAVRTAASRAMKNLGIQLRVLKVNDPDDKEYGRIGVYRTK